MSDASGSTPGARVTAPPLVEQLLAIMYRSNHDIPPTLDEGELRHLVSCMKEWAIAQQEARDKRAAASLSQQRLRADFAESFTTKVRGLMGKMESSEEIVQGLVLASLYFTAASDPGSSPHEKACVQAQGTAIMECAKYFSEIYKVHAEAKQRTNDSGKFWTFVNCKGFTVLLVVAFLAMFIAAALGFWFVLRLKDSASQF